MTAYQQYDAIESNINGVPSSQRLLQDRRFRNLLLAAVGIGGYVLVAMALFKGRHSTPQVADTPSTQSLPMPFGVNFGSWLSLEDYFYVGSHPKIPEVATPFNHTAAHCLPPLLMGSSWDSETDLLSKLEKEHSLRHAIQVFHAHRTTFIDWETDLAILSMVGIHHVRVPISWCLTDHDPSTISQEDSDETLRERFTCADPYFENTYWPAIPRSLIEDFLKACARHNIQALLDVHTYPGGTSIGTFSGVWPRICQFWNHDEPGSPQQDTGRRLFREFVSWMETLDEPAMEGLFGISPMNEPGRLAGMFGPGSFNPDTPSFLPPLSQDEARVYLETLNGDEHTTVPDGPHLRVLLWLSDAVETFRQSSLPSRGIGLHVNVHESIFALAVLPRGEFDDAGGRHPGATRIVASWWNSVSSPEERLSWASLDMHHYHAWEPQCQGTADGSMGNYTCGNVVGRDDALRRCTSWAQMFRDAVDEECGPGAKLDSAEFSPTTHHNIREACLDLDTLKASYLAQIQAAKQAEVNLFWWSWKMPHGGPFRASWSLKQFLYQNGILSHPDESKLGCE